MNEKVIERARLGVEANGSSLDPGRVHEAELSAVPETARRYLRFMGVVGRPRDRWFRMRRSGRFRLGPDRPWLPCHEWQYNFSLEIARMLRVRPRIGGVLLDLGGTNGVQPSLVVRTVDLFGITDARREADHRRGELVTWLDDAVFHAPSMLIGRASWSAVDDTSFDVALTDLGQTVSARVFLDEHGAPRELATGDRPCGDSADPARPVRALWTTPMERWEKRGGRPVPTAGRAVWHLPQGEFSYAEFHSIPGSLVYNPPAHREVKNEPIHP